MEFVQEAMKNRGEDNADARDESDPAKERVTTGEKFAARCLNGRERAHARQNHRGVREGIQPRKFLEVVVSSHADAKCPKDNSQAENGATSESGVKDPAWQQRLGAALVHVCRNM